MNTVLRWGVLVWGALMCVPVHAMGNKGWLERPCKVRSLENMPLGGDGKVQKRRFSRRQQPIGRLCDYALGLLKEVSECSLLWREKVKGSVTYAEAYAALVDALAAQLEIRGEPLASFISCLEEIKDWECTDFSTSLRDFMPAGTRAQVLATLQQRLDAATISAPSPEPLIFSDEESDGTPDEEGAIHLLGDAGQDGKRGDDEVLSLSVSQPAAVRCPAAHGGRAKRKVNWRRFNPFNWLRRDVPLILVVQRTPQGVLVTPLIPPAGRPDVTSSLAAQHATLCPYEAGALSDRPSDAVPILLIDETPGGRDMSAAPPVVHLMDVPVPMVQDVLVPAVSELEADRVEVFSPEQTAPPALLCLEDGSAAGKGAVLVQQEGGITMLQATAIGAGAAAAGLVVDYMMRKENSLLGRLYAYMKKGGR